MTGRATTSSSRSRRRSCSRPMPSASSRWPSRPTIPASTGSSRKRAASSRSTASTCPRRLARTVAADVFEIRIDSDFDAVIAGCAAAGAGPRQDLDQRPHPPALRRAVRRSATATRSRPGGTASWSAGSTASRSAPPSSARACSRRERDASKVALVHLVARLQGRRLPPARHPVHHRAPEAVRRHRRRPPPLPAPARGGDRRRGRFLPLGAAARPARRSCSRSARRHRPAWSTAWRPGLAANIQPVKMRCTLRLSVISSTSTKASVCGASVGGPRVADPRRHLQRAELHRLVDVDVEGDDAAGDLVEAGEDRDRVGDLARPAGVWSSPSWALTDRRE